MKTNYIVAGFALLVSAAVAQPNRPSAFGLAPEKFAQVNEAVRQAHLNDGAIAEINDRIDELLAQRDELVVAAAIAARPELKEELAVFLRGQAELRKNSRSARELHRREATKAKTAPPKKGGS